MRKKLRKTPSYHNLRLAVALVVFLGVFGAVFARAFELQVLDSPKLKKMAASQHTKTLTVQSRRGDIYDRNGKALAVSIEVDSVYAQTTRIKSVRDASRELAAALSMKRSEVESALRSRRGFVWIKRQVDLTDEARAKVMGIDGMGIVKESRRYYPNRHLAGNILGFTGVDSKGLEGLELYYDNVLSGATLTVTGDRDARGGVLLFEDVDKRLALEGMRVELTIDKTIQYIAEKALKKGVDSSGAKSGSAVVMDPYSGEILALAAYPSFDPNSYRSFSPADWRNRVVTDVYEPGSTLKPFLIAAAIEEEVVKPGDIIFCENGRYKVADRVFHDTKKHGWLSVPQILKYSSNIGSAKIGERMGAPRLYRYLKSFGFGERTGVDMPGESAGSLRHHSKWSAVTVDTVSFGQGISATSVQLASAISAIANGGFLMKPYVVRSVRTPEGKAISETHPVVVRRVIAEETAKRVTDMMVGVTGEGGTGTKASMVDFEVAGKTATAQKPDLVSGGYRRDAYLSSFVGFAPARSPRLVILVSIDEPTIENHYYGGDVAAPVFREIAAQGFSYLGMLPARRSAPGGDGSPKLVKASADSELVVAPRRLDAAVEAGNNKVPDFTGMTMREALSTAVAIDAEVRFDGSGRAASQSPRPGANMPADGVVHLTFR